MPIREHGTDRALELHEQAGQATHVVCLSVCLASKWISGFNPQAIPDSIDFAPES